MRYYYPLAQGAAEMRKVEVNGLKKIALHLPRRMEGCIVFHLKAMNNFELQSSKSRAKQQFFGMLCLVKIPLFQ